VWIAGTDYEATVRGAGGDDLRLGRLFVGVFPGGSDDPLSSGMLNALGLAFRCCGLPLLACLRRSPRTERLAVAAVAEKERARNPVRGFPPGLESTFFLLGAIPMKE
jgi:hypothetical protein